MTGSVPTDGVNEPRMFTFVRGDGKEREIGPYRSVHGAKEAFMWVFGYWPDEPIRVRPYEFESTR